MRLATLLEGAGYFFKSKLSQIKKKLFLAIKCEVGGKFILKKQVVVTQCIQWNL